MVYGVGINDVDYVLQTESIVYVDGQRKRKVIWRCPFYRAWISMLQRCYDTKWQEYHTTYSGCSVCAHWLILSNFKAWMETQDWEGNHLDKDILFSGNKIYSSETCVFVSRVVNTFVIENTASRGQWPIGVHWHKKSGKFQAKCNNPITNKREHLGMFICPKEAHKAWLRRKLELAYEVAAEQPDKRVAEALIRRYQNYTELVEEEL